MARAQSPIETLTPRELEVLELIAAAKTNREIAERLGIRFETAKWHVSEVLQKLQVSSREEAAREYRRYRRLPARLGRGLSAIPAVAKWAGAGVAAVLVVGVVAVVSFLLLKGGDDKPATPDTTPTPVASATGAPGESPTATASPGPTPTLPAGEAPIVDLSPGAPMSVAGAVLYYDVNLPSDAPGSYDRAYIDEAGQLVEETLSHWINDVINGDSTVLSVSMSLDARTLVARVCRTPCLAGQGQLQEDAEIDWLRSTDGGVSWERLGGRFDQLTPSAAARVAGVFTDGRIVVEELQGPAFWVYPSGEDLVPPRPDTSPVVTAAGELLWQGRTGDTTVIGYWDSNGERVFGLQNVDNDLARANAGAVFHIVHVDEQDRAYFLSHYASVSELRVVSRSGDVLQAWRWPGAMTTIGGPEDGKLVGIVHAPGEDDQERFDRMPSDWEGPSYPWRLALIDLVEGEIRPITGLQPLGLAPGGRLDGLDPSVQTLLMVDLLELIVGNPLRVNTGGSCLNVRAEPAATAESLRCYVDGVLLFEREADAPDGWVAVTTPDGRDGWASADFLER